MIGHGSGFFLNPLTLPMEVTHLLEKSYERTGDWRDAIDSYVRGRLSTLMRPVADIATKHDAMGRPITTAGTIADTVPLPIAGGAVVNAGKQVMTGKPSESFPGQFQKQAMATFGVRTDQAPSPVQRIQALASDFKRDRNIPTNAEFYTGDYQPFSQAVRVGNPDDEKKALDDLLQKKTPQAVEKHFRDSLNFPFTGSRTHEAQFYRTLSPEQQSTYRQAVQDRRQLAIDAIRALRQRFARPAQTPAQP
jgi:hypothetical protein